MNFFTKITIAVIVFAVFISTTLFILYRDKIFKNSVNNNPQQETKKEKVIFNVAIQNYAFSPVEATIKEGTTVVWTNNDPISHTVKLGDIASTELAKNQTFEYTFFVAGEYGYYCGLHPSMQGKVIVE